LDQLKLANELCFPEDFVYLWARHSSKDPRSKKAPDYDPDLEARIYLLEFQRAGGLYNFIATYSRKDLEDGFAPVFDAILEELLLGYTPTYPLRSNQPLG
jgi:hypothetical protein